MKIYAVIKSKIQMKVQMKKYIFILFIALLVSSDSLSMGLLKTCAEFLMPNLKQKVIKESLSESELELNDALLISAEDGKYLLVKFLLEAGVNVNYKIENTGGTALMRANWSGHIKVVRLLLEFGAKVDIQDEDGWTALMYASRRVHIELVRLLLEKGANVNHQDKDGNTALMWASSKGHVELVRLLLEKGANVNYQNKYGRTALRYARKNHHTEIERILKEAGATE